MRAPRLPSVQFVTSYIPLITKHITYLHFWLKVCYFYGHYKESDVRAAYAKLRELMTPSTPPDAKRTDIETQAKLIDDFMRNNIIQKN